MVKKSKRAAGRFMAGFRNTIMGGNLVDLAVVVTIGAAFSK